MKKKLSKTQAICITLFWMALAYLLLTHVEHIDGPVVLWLLLSAAFVFVPVFQSLRKR